MRSFLDMIKYEAKQFCLHTALHGYRFIILPKRILLERVTWSIIVLISLITALVLLFMAWFQFQENPTLLVTDSTHYPIWFFPFPAVTICSYNKISKAKAFELSKNLTKILYGMSRDEIAEDLRFLVHLTNSNQKLAIEKYQRIQDILDANRIDVYTALKVLAPSCKDILQRCKWKGEEKRCDSIFEQIVTSEGFCCSFNYYALKNHKFSGALSNKAPLKPRRVSACGYQTALEIIVDTNVSDYFASTFSSFGHHYLLDESYNFPDWTSQSLLHEKSRFVFVGIQPTITLATDYIKSLSIEKRGCLFPNEKELFNFQHYTYHNCITECRMNLTIKYCNCIPFYFYHPEGNQPKSRVCNLRDLNCLEEYYNIIFNSLPGYDFTSKFLTVKDITGNERNTCNCLPDCEYVHYLAEASDSILTRNFSTNQLNLYGGIIIGDQTVFRIFFNDLIGTKNRRDILYTWHTLLGYYGGLLGLFIGFSFVSAIEIIYFFTVRLITDASNEKKNKNKSNFHFNKTISVSRFQKQNKIQTVKPPVSQTVNLDPKNLLNAYNNNEDTEIRFRSNSNSWFAD